MSFTVSLWRRSEPAMSLATERLAELRQFCERIDIAGSLRRHKETVKDIELLYIPKFVEAPPPPSAQGELFTEPGPPVRIDLCHNYLTAQLATPGSRWSKRPGENGVTAFGPMNKLMQFRVTDDYVVAIDIFTATAANWGRDLWFRTGPKEWNIASVTRARALNLRMHAYGPAAFTRYSGDELPINCADETDVARVLRLGPVTSPEYRTAETARQLSNV